MKILKWVILVLVVLGGLGLLGVLALVYGNSLFQQAHLAYGAGECKIALPIYQRISAYPDWAGKFVAQAAAEQAECLAYEVTVSLAAGSEPEAVIANFTSFRETYPASALAPVALDQIEATYLAWGDSLRSAGSFAEALTVYEKMAGSHFQLSEGSQAQSLQTYLEWAESLAAAGDFAGAIGTYDTMSGLGEAFAAAAAVPASQAHLDWASQLASASLFGDAERVYRQLLQREQDRQLPVNQSALSWPAVNRFPYAIAEVRLAQTTLRTGPGEAFEPFSPTSAQAARRHFGVLGASLDGNWLALSLGQEISSLALEAGADLRKLPWSGSLDPVVWAPAADLRLSLAFSERLPVPGVLLSQVSQHSPEAAAALEGLETIYTAWAAEASQAGDVETARGLYQALPELTPDPGQQNEIFQQMAQVCLQTAERLAAESDYAQSISYTWYAEDFDRFGPALAPARALRISDWMQLGAQAASQADWETAANFYTGVIAYEQELTGQGADLPAWQAEQAAVQLAAVQRDWGIQLKNAGQPLDAIAMLRKAQAQNPDPAFIQEVQGILASILAEAGQAVKAGGGCAQVKILDSLASDPQLAPQAQAHLPQALYQCGQEALTGSGGLGIADAESAFNRVGRDFPSSEYAAKAQRGLLWVAWTRTVQSQTLENAARDLCAAASQNAQASVSSLEKPFKVFFYGHNLNTSLPEEWHTASGSAPTVVVCTAEEAKLIQTCSYQQGHLLYRYRYEMTLRIVDPLNGKTVLTGVLKGSNPEACEFVEFFTGSTKSYYGEAVPPQEALDWLRRYLK